MKRVILATVGTIVGLIMLLSFKTRPTTTAAATTTPPAAVAGPAGSNSSTGQSGSSGSGSSGSGTTAPAGSSSGTKTVTGTESETRYGPVQVKITLTNGSVTSVEATEYPNERPRDYQINSYAIPQLDQEATQAKNARIDMVSGATYTSEGYIESFQSALNQAGLS